MKTQLLRYFTCCIGMFAAFQLSAVTIATPVELDSPGVVGTATGLAGDNQSDEIVFAQHLLDLPANTVNLLFNNHYYNTSPTEYWGTIEEGLPVSGTSVAAGWDFAIAKYDGENAGYILFSLNGLATELPRFSYKIWGANAEQYEISHYTPFHARVPENGKTVGLLGLAFMAIALVRRIFP